MPNHLPQNLSRGLHFQPFQKWFPGPSQGLSASITQAFEMSEMLAFQNNAHNSGFPLPKFYSNQTFDLLFWNPILCRSKQN